MRASFLFQFLLCLLSLFFHPLLWSSFLLLFSLSFLFFFIFSCLLHFLSHYLFSLISLHSFLYFPLISFIISFSTSTLFSLSLLLPFLSFFFLSLFFSSSLFCFLNASSVPLIGHNHKVWKTLTQVKPFILHLRKPRLIEMEFSKITYYVLVINRVRFRM